MAKRFSDPVNLVREGKLRIDLGTLRAVIQPMGTIEPIVNVTQQTSAVVNITATAAEAAS
jgi:hypothetical protein